VFYLFPLRAMARFLSPASVFRLGRLLEPLAQVAMRSRRVELVSRMEKALGVGRQAGDMARLYIRNALFRSLDDLVMDRLFASGGARYLAFEGREHLESALARGRGAILLTGHFYANRAGKRYLSSIGFPVLSIRNRATPERRSGRLGMACLRDRYFRFLNSVIRDEVWIQDPECTLKILKRLRANGIVNVHLDAAYSSFVYACPFLDKDGRFFPTGFLRIARLSGAPILPTLFVGDSRSLTIRIEEPHPLELSQDEELLIQSNLPALVGRLERQIRSHPDQWELWTQI